MGVTWFLGVGTQDNAQGHSQGTETVMGSRRGSQLYFPEITWLATTRFVFFVQGRELGTLHPISIFAIHLIQRY